ncbi:hypothetical protein [Bosea rubneri]|uniref:Uncharacterized protein n=1 Tax=Bosea rubneri TaxID=3075434 RepID=A0ABU3SGB4_9HYPH|nr:hypothetical protein [Bosea sp. ZW T0_25]MDU0343706.1 hypothetical protein [Bosea sp. ZW T0_25]
MSAIQIFLTEEAAVVLTDGALYDNDNGNVITAITTKTLPLPHLSCVIASRGHSGFAEDLAPRLGRTFRSFEELVGNLALSVEIAWENAPEEVRAYGGIELYAIGWSHERGRAEAYVVTNAPAYGGGWHAAEIKDYASAPPVPLAAMPDDLVAAGIAIAEDQRAYRDEDGNGGVGGFLQMTQVTPQAIHTAIVHRWPDMIGDCLRDAA